MKTGTPSVISVSGLAGTGTTTISKMLAYELGYEHVYAGAIIREMAAEHNMDIVAFNDLIIGEPEWDYRVDNLIIEKAREGKKILEGRLSGWMMDKGEINAFKVLLTVSPDEQTRRVAGRDAQNLGEAKEAISKREAGNEKRYKGLYPDVNYHELYPDFAGNSIFDVRIDTTEKTPDDICEEILKKYKHS